MQKKDTETFSPVSRQDWRKWLKKNHSTKASVWLIYYKRKLDRPTLTYSDAVDEALCFGWIDSTRKSLGEDRYTQFFCKRKPKSNWSKINKEKIKRLIEEGSMTEAGLESIAAAKKNGSWTVSDAIEKLTMPKDLTAALDSKPGAKDYFMSLSRSVKKMILHWIASAKRPETRQKRIDETAENASHQQKPAPFR